jgi:hypothetical protein
LTSFVDLVADPAAPPSGRDEVALMLGKHEAEEGRSLDSLQAAYRIGRRPPGNVSWRWAIAPSSPPPSCPRSRTRCSAT